MKLASTPALQSRVGKRVLGLVLAAALIPLAALVLLLEGQVSALLLEQGGRRIASAAKVYAFGVFDRLLIARETARYADRAAPNEGAPLAARHFQWLAIADASGKSKTLIGTPDPEGLQWASLLAKDKWTAPSKLRGTEARLLLAQQATAQGSVLVGLLNPAFIWGEDDELPAGMTPCVIADGHALHCPMRFAADKLASLDATRGQSKTERIPAPGTGGAYLGTAWPLFMRNEFATGDWIFAVLADEDELLGTLHTFRRALAAAVALSVLLSFLISMRHIAGILVPLNMLTSRTRRIAERDFGGRTDVQSGDEFEELGDALNTMSNELSRQFQLTEAHAYIDREILARSPLERVLAAALARLLVLVPTMRLGVLVFERQTSDTALHVAISGRAEATLEGRVETERIHLPDSMRAELRSMRGGTVLSPEAAPGWLRGLLHVNARRATLYPIVWGEAPCGILVLQHQDDAGLDEQQLRIVAEFSDHIAVATSSAWREEALYFQAHHDALTQLPNRLLFRERLEHEIARSERTAGELAVLFVDLDHFKAINDTQGHGAGDQLLRIAAERIRSAVRESDTVARYGGDEFTVLLTGMSDHSNALRVADKIVEALSPPFRVGGIDSLLSASVGISVCPNDGRDADSLLRNADLAMYRAKVAGRGQCLFFEEQMNAEAVARFALDREMRAAVERGEYELHYQPQVATATGRVVAAEALVRWRHPTRGLLTPDHFISAAEASGAIRDIGAWVLREACNQFRQWRDAGLDLERLSINVSARQLSRDDFVDLVEATFSGDASPLPIELEITESVMLEQTAALHGRLGRLTAMGCSIALDDFGTAFSSMSYLKRLPVHCVKIDREFVMDLERDKDSRTFVDAIVRMSHALGKRVVAEGVETAAQASLLRELDCDYLQGYYHAMPMLPAQFLRFVEERNRPSTQVFVAQTQD